MSNYCEQIISLSPKKRELFDLLLKEREKSTVNKSIRRRSNLDEVPLSFAQQRIWFMDLWMRGAAVYNTPITARVSGPLDIKVLEKAVNEILRRHDVLRATFVNRDGNPVQIIQPSLAISIPLVDLEFLPEYERKTEMSRIATADSRQAFDLASGPLMRTKVFRLRENEYLLQLIIHHILFDGWSIGVLLNELSVLYEALLCGQRSPLPEMPIQYADFAQWQRESLQGEVLSEHLSYWKEKLSGVSGVPNLPTDRPRPPVESLRGAQVSLMLNGELLESLKALGQSMGSSLFMVLLAAFQILLQRYSGQDDVVVGSPIANQTNIQTEGLIGLFVNTLVLRSNVNGHRTFRELLSEVRETTLDAYRHQDLPFEILVEELQLERVVSHIPLVQVVFALQNVPLPKLEFAGIKVEPDIKGIDPGTSKFDLFLSTCEEPEGLLCIFEYSTDLFDAQTIERMAGHYEEVLEGIVANPEQRICELPLLTGAEEQQLLVEWNETGSAYPRESSIEELFEAQAAATPGAVAVVDKDEELSYEELNRRGNQLAHYLRRRGVEAETLVGICLDRSVEMVVGLLGILKAGGAYVALDAEYPRERLAYMVADAELKLVLTRADLLERLPVGEGEGEVEAICLDQAGEWLAGESVGNVGGSAGKSGRRLAYVSYTSGSTGEPKGVEIEHRGVVRLVKQTNYIEIKADDVLLQMAPLSFDASTFEVWGALLNGAKLAVMGAGRASLGDIAGALQRYQVTTLWLTAGLFQQMVDEELAALQRVRQVLAGGDVLSVAHVERLLAGGGVRVINGYGPTENTTFTCCHVMEGPQELQGSVPIGRPIANTTVYLLDERLQPVPVGVRGELYAGGDGLARGYLKRPELTAERFIAHPFSAEPEARLYKTGDEARYLADGRIEFLGRKDQQVKLRGYRIELGEVEAVLGRHAGVRATVVEAVGSGIEKRLVAYVVGDGPVSEGELRQWLRERLPEYMTPAQFVLLEQLPLTPNGKVDRKALPAAGVWQRQGSECIAPRTATESVIAEIWQEVLKVKKVGVTDNFFELGGHSLLATQVVSRVRERLAVEVALRQAFEQPTVAGLAQAVEAATILRQEKEKTGIGEKSIGTVAGLILPVSREAHRAKREAFEVKEDYMKSAS